MSDEQVRCTSCGRSFGLRTAGPSGRCMYCGGKLAGPGLEHLELVQDEAGSAAPPGSRPEPRKIEVLKGTPSRWDRPITALQELLVLAMLLMLAALAVGTMHRHDPLLPPSALRVAVLVSLPVLWAGGLCLRTGFELFTGPARSVIAALPMLALGLVLGLPSVVARFLARLQGRIFGLPGALAVLVVFLAGMASLNSGHDPTVGAAAWLEAQHSPELIDPDWLLQTSGWTGRLSGEGEGGFALRIERVEGSNFEGSLTWVQSGRVDQIRGSWKENHLVFPYPGPPWIERWWFSESMLSTMELWVLGDNQLQGGDMLFGHSARGRRVWQRATDPVLATRRDTAPASQASSQAPLLEPPVVLRPLIQIEDRQISRGRAFALRLAPGTEPVLVTAASLFGPDGGLSRQINPQMLPALVGDAIFFDLLEGAMRARGGIQRPPSGARPVEIGGEALPDASHDLVTLTLLPGHSVRPLELSTSPVSADQQLWLPDRPVEAMGSEESLLVAKVIASWEHGFSVRLADPSLLDGQTGAPLLDSQGRVAGMLVANAKQGNGSAVGIAIPAHWIRARLQP